MAGPDTSRNPFTADAGPVSCSVSVGTVEPVSLLRLGEGKPRGFWAREGRWIVHVGQVGSLTVEDGREDGSRFSRVWQAGQALGSPARLSSRGNGGPPAARYFGGFSFAADHRAEEIWEAFPPAHFVLPEIELVQEGGQGTLTLRRIPMPGEGRDSVARSLRARGEALRVELERIRREPGPRPGGSISTCLRTDQEAWAAMVGNALAAIRSGEVSKVVMARAVSASYPDLSGPDPVDVVLDLWARNPGSHVFLFEPGPGRSLVGAAPETVATVAGGAFRATAVAGSIARGRTAEEAEVLARELLDSEKDRREHAFCVDDMVARLDPVAGEVRADPEPHVLTLSAIQHLETIITGTLREGETALTALEALHPTPAVCGYPRDPALELLQRSEATRRGWYAGPVGWFDLAGDGVFVPALRSAVRKGGEWHLFSGAGIVAGSDPEKEWAETDIKLRPVLEALAGEGAP